MLHPLPRVHLPRSCDHLARQARCRRHMFSHLSLMARCGGADSSQPLAGLQQQWGEPIKSNETSSMKHISYIRIVTRRGVNRWKKKKNEIKPLKTQHNNVNTHTPTQSVVNIIDGIEATTCHCDSDLPKPKVKVKNFFFFIHSQTVFFCCCNIFMVQPDWGLKP